MQERKDKYDPQAWPETHQDEPKAVLVLTASILDGMDTLQEKLALVHRTKHTPSLGAGKAEGAFGGRWSCGKPTR